MEFQISNIIFWCAYIPNIALDMVIVKILFGALFLFAVSLNSSLGHICLYIRYNISTFYLESHSFSLAPL